MLMKYQYQNYNQIPRSDIIIRWCDIWYDGPMSGMAYYKEKKVYFDFCDEYEETEEDIQKYELDYEYKNSWYRRFVIFELTPEEIDQKEKDKDLFLKYVGNYRHNYEDKPPLDYELCDQKNWKIYYDRDRSNDIKIDLSEKLILGWFEIK